MYKKELISAVTKRLYELDKRKPIRIQKHTFYISDSNGDSTSFEVGYRAGEYLYNSNDVANIIDATMDVIIDAIRSGDMVHINGFGELRLHRRAARRTVRPDTGEPVEVAERLVPKFFFGSKLRMAARSFELIRDEKENAPKLPDPVYDDEEDEDISIEDGEDGDV